jgi:hypothetical protein
MITLLLTLPAVSHGQERGGVNPRVAVPIVLDALGRAHSSGSLEYWGRCDLDQLPDFPRMQAVEKYSDSAVETLRAIFSSDTEMRVTRDPDGMVRMTEMDSPTDLLNVHISHIAFKWEYDGTGDVLYDPRHALWAILNTPEVRAFLKSHDIGAPFKFEEAHIGFQRSPDSPHISGELSNVTLSQALDYVLRTFPGFWVYENCHSTKKRRVVFFTFFQSNLLFSSAR